MKIQPSSTTTSPVLSEDPLRMDRPCVLREIDKGLFKVNTGLATAFSLAHLAQYRGQNIEILDEQTGQPILKIIEGQITSEDPYTVEQYGTVSASIFQVAKTILMEFNTIDRVNYERAQLALVRAVEEGYSKEIARLQALTQDLEAQVAALKELPVPRPLGTDAPLQTEQAPQAD